jgi:hypothetical protein
MERNSLIQEGALFMQQGIGEEPEMFVREILGGKENL